MIGPFKWISSPPGLWVSAAALIGFISSATFSSWLHLSRGAFVLAYGAVAGLFLTTHFITARVRPTVQLRRHWRMGLVGGLVLGGLLAHAVHAQPPSARPAGTSLAWAMIWLGVVYGTLDALLLSVLPVLTIYGSRPPETMLRATARLRSGGLSLLASLAITAAYHVGFAEFRGPALVQPLIGNAILTAGYLITGSPLAAVLGHVIMHEAAILHGMETTAQLPPHY
jgi:hypothetical protein